MPPPADVAVPHKSAQPGRASAYRPWAELLKRTFAVDALVCPRCSGRMKLIAIVEEPKSVARYLTAIGEPTDVPRRSPGRAPPYWKSRVLRRKALGNEETGRSGGSNGSDETA